LDAKAGVAFHAMIVVNIQSFANPAKPTMGTVKYLFLRIIIKEFADRTVILRKLFAACDIATTLLNWLYLLFVRCPPHESNLNSTCTSFLAWRI
jgi:hypothetical protein